MFTYSYDEKEGILTIKIKIPSQPEMSKSGKSLLLASTRGFRDTGLKINGKEVHAGINIISPK